MSEQSTGTEAGPEIALRQGGVAPSGKTGDWKVEWEVQNRGDDSIEIGAARLPHGQFKAQEIRFEPRSQVAAGGSFRFQATVRCHEPSGPVTENAFAIIDVLWKGKAWRVFARVRVVVDSEGKPRASTESVTTQKIGFSGIDF